MGILHTKPYFPSVSPEILHARPRLPLYMPWDPACKTTSSLRISGDLTMNIWELLNELWTLPVV